MGAGRHETCAQATLLTLTEGMTQLFKGCLKCGDNAYRRKTASFHSEWVQLSFGKKAWREPTFCLTPSHSSPPEKKS